MDLHSSSKTRTIDALVCVTRRPAGPGCVAFGLGQGTLKDLIRGASDWTENEENSGTRQHSSTPRVHPLLGIFNIPHYIHQDLTLLKKNGLFKQTCMSLSLLV